MSKQFTLTLTITGESLEEIDNLLVQAGGERIRARMVNPPAGPLGEVKVMTNAPKEEVLQKVETPVNVEKPKKKPGRQPGLKMGPYNKETGKYETSNSSEEASSSVTQAPIEGAFEPAQASPEASPPPRQEASAPTQVVAEAQQVVVPAAKPTGTIATLDDAVKALTHVNSKFNIDRARGCLSHFNVKKCSDLTDANRGEFISHCYGLV